MNRYLFAKIISRIFDFYFIVPLMFFVIIFGLDLKVSFLFVFLYLLIPILFFVIFLLVQFIRHKFVFSKIDFDLSSNKKDRLLSGLIISIWLIIGTIIAIFIHTSIIFISILYLFTAIIVLANIITIFWKISFHSIMISSLFVMVLLVNPLLSLIVLPFIPIVGYSRIILKKHNFEQVVAGFLLVISMFLLFYKLGFFIIK